MGDYYLYLLDRAGKIARRVDLHDCTDDDHARDIAAANTHSGAMELWQGNRRVQVFGDLSARAAVKPKQP